LAVILRTDRKYYSSIHRLQKAFAREKHILLAARWKKSVAQNKEKVFIAMHNAIKKLHSTQFVFLHSQPTRQSEAAIFAPHCTRLTLSLRHVIPPSLMHETFINKSFIAIDVFNGEKYEIVL
jgi:hypothetical protein